MFILKQIEGQKSAVNLQTHVLFVDLTKASGSISICLLWHINQSLITAGKNVYKNSVSTIKTANTLSTPFFFKKVLRLSCSYLIQDIYERSTKEVEEKCSAIGIPLEHS